MRPIRALPLALLLITAPACTHKTLQRPTKATDAVPTGGEVWTPEAVQSAVMGYSDTYTTRMAEACGKLMTPGTPEELQMWAEGHRVAGALGVFTIASAPNALVSLLDMCVYVTLRQRIFDEHWAREMTPEAIAPVVDAHRVCEAEVWQLAAKVLTPEQITELRGLINKWREDHPNEVFVSHVRMSEFGAYRQQAAESASDLPRSVFSLLYLDPLASLDPAAREVRSVRFATERAMFFAQRLPIIVPWHVQQTLNQSLRAKEVREAVAAATRASVAAEEFSKTVSGLPQMIADEHQRLIADLEAADAKVRPMLSEANATLAQAEKTAQAIDQAVKSLDDFIRLVNPPPDPNAPPKPKGAGKGFDVLDYGKAATDIGAAAERLDTAIRSLNGLVHSPEKPAGLTQAAADLEASTKRTLDRARGVGLTLIGAAGGVALVVGFILSRLKRRA